MLCPKCKEMVNPVSTDFLWLPIIDAGDTEKLTEHRLLTAIYIWDQGAMYAAVQSILPTELRNAIERKLGARTVHLIHNELRKFMLPNKELHKLYSKALKAVFTEPENEPEVRNPYFDKLTELLSDNTKENK